MVEVVSFEAAMEGLNGAKKRHLLLGNGFSIALKPNIFTYGSLYENADFSAVPHVKKLFQALGTQDFEVVIKHLQDAARVVEVYRPSAKTLARRLRNDAAAIKDALVTAIAKRHPDRPYDVTAEQYAACRAFLGRFDHLFTLNYDVLLYWALMQEEVDERVFRHDDGFRHPEDEPDQPWVSWQQGNSATVSYLHGALHLFDAGSEITKYTWSKTDKPIVEQIGRPWRKRSTRSSWRKGKARPSSSASCTAATCTRRCAASKPAAPRRATRWWCSVIRSPQMTGMSSGASPRAPAAT
ncbi:DUF4917 family protein [Roseomonas vastitatis]|uniref:DUF4917 family protein n=1 Tax=Teichococcus vastitatis TaxID=2307076 RepID=A0ABS9W8D5_9PROT|nr:DUF4917 family protein [Pseudoroseomonas vastitatis]MCI0755549.1 DUF4917 family protein [Pseudoroseomonas vastitatis]